MLHINTPGTTVYQDLEKIYLSFINDYLTLDNWALDLGLTPNEGFRLLQGLKKMFDKEGDEQ